MSGTSGKKDHPGEKGPYRGKIKLSGREVEYTVRVSPRARNVRLRVGIGIGLEVIAPGGFKPGKNLEEILRQNHKWILNKLDMISRVAQSRTKPGQKDPGSILYRGREYRIATLLMPAGITGWSFRKIK